MKDASDTKITLSGLFGDNIDVCDPVIVLTTVYIAT